MTDEVTEYAVVITVFMAPELLTEAAELALGLFGIDAVLLPESRSERFPASLIIQVRDRTKDSDMQCEQFLYWLEVNQYNTAHNPQLIYNVTTADSIPPAFIMSAKGIPSLGAKYFH